MDVELEFDKKCRVSLSPKTVLPFYPKSSSIIENCKKPMDQSLVVEDGRVECNRSASCRSIPSRLSVVEGPMELKRGSVYQDSREVRKTRSMGDGASRRKIEISRTSYTKNAVSLDHNGNGERCTDLPVHPALIRVAASKADEEACSSYNFIDIDIDMNDGRKLFRKGLDGDLSYLVDEVDGPVYDSSILLEEDEFHSYVREKSETPQTYLNRSSVDTPKSLASTKFSRFSPIKKMMDPFLKSKSHKSPLSFESGGHNNETLLNPLPCSVQDMKEHVLVARDSPALLHACLTLKTKHETPMFEFMLNCPEVSFLARIWKRNLNAGDWVYTFHSFNARKRRNFSLWGSNDDCKELPIVGQMQVSSGLCPESNTIADKSMVTEFVLYDLSNTTKSKSVHDNSDAAQDISQPLNVSERMSNDLNISKGHNSKQSLDAYPANLACPWEPAILHPNLESAAGIIRIPLEKRESLKFNKRVAKASGNSMPDINVVQNSSFRYDLDVSEVVVVTPACSHSLPDAISQGPSSLLDRWRLGGGCECGGWDMGCPLNVFSNPVTQKVDRFFHRENTHRYKLFVQGEKGKTSALSIKIIEEGKYDVAFHARLSALQAFSISVAMLHGFETSSIQMDINSELITTQRSPLKLLTEHELEHPIEAFAMEGTKHIRPSNKERHLNFSVHPPFSPMSRV